MRRVESSLAAKRAGVARLGLEPNEKTCDWIEIEKRLAADGWVQIAAATVSAVKCTRRGRPKACILAGKYLVV